MFSIIVFWFTNFIGGLLLTISFIGFAMNFLCYLCEKTMFFPMYVLWLALGIGFVIELIGAIFGFLFLKKGI